MPCSICNHKIHDPGKCKNCNACGRIVDASWVAREGARQMVIVVEKCNCDSPLLKD